HRMQLFQALMYYIWGLGELNSNSVVRIVRDAKSVSYQYCMQLANRTEKAAWHLFMKQTCILRCPSARNCCKSRPQLERPQRTERESLRGTTSPDLHQIGDLGCPLPGRVC